MVDLPGEATMGAGGGGGGGAEDDDADFGDGSTFDAAFKFLEQPPAALGFNDGGAGATATEASATLSSVVNGLTHQIPSSSGGKSLQWDPNLVTYMGTSTSSLNFLDTDMKSEGSMHLSEASFDMNSPPLDDYNTGMRDFSIR